MTSEPLPALSDEPLDDDEEAVLAVLDDDATAEQRRRVARDPALRARLEEHRATASALAAEVPSPPEATLAARRAAALDAALDPAVDADPDPDPDPGPDRPEEHEERERAEEAPEAPIPLAARRRARRLPPLPAVAAVVVLLVALGATLILTDSGSESTQTAAEGTDLRAEDATDSPASADAGEAAPSTTAAGDAAAPEASADATDATGAPLLSYDDEEELRRSLGAVDPLTLDAPGAVSAADAAASVDDEAVRCSVVLEASDPAVEPAQAARPVLLEGERVLVLSNPVAATAEEPANTRLTVLEPTGCIPLFAVQR